MSWTDYTVPNDTPVAAAIIATCIATLCMLVLKPKADGDQFVTEEAPAGRAHRGTGTALRATAVS